MRITKLAFIAFSALLSFHSMSASAQSTIPAEPMAPLPKNVENIEQFLPEDIYALPWKAIMEQDIMWRKRVWREIDVSSMGNEAFANLGKLLMEGVFDGTLKAYDSKNDRFTKQLSKEDCISLLAHSSNGPVSGFNPANVAKFRIKEDWLFTATDHKMVVRIVGIAPVMEVTQPDGSVTEQPALWFYYPYCREYLSKHQPAANSQNWDQLFESRNFKSKITQVTAPFEEPQAYNAAQAK